MDRWIGGSFFDFGKKKIETVMRAIYCHDCCCCFFCCGVKMRKLGDVSAADCDEVQPFESVKRHGRGGSDNSWSLAHF